MAVSTQKKAPISNIKPTKEAQRKPSLGKGLFLGEVISELLFPYPTPDENSNDALPVIIDSIQKWGKELNLHRIETEKAIPAEYLEQMKGLGLFGLIIPEEYGGLGLSTTAYVQILSVISSIDASISTTVGAHQSIGMKALLLFGDKNQKEQFLPKLASGEMIAAFGLTEPGAGSDARSLKTTAELDKSGDFYILNGSKIWITNGGIANFFTVFARTFHGPEKKERITAFIVTRDMAGFSNGPEEKKMGLWGSSTTSLTFDNVKIPKENVLGEPGEGFKVAMEVLNNGRLGLAAACALGTQRCIEMALKHAHERKQFGKHLAEFGMIQSKLATLASEQYAAEAMVRLVAKWMDRGDVDYSLETAICKIFSTELQWKAIHEAIQIAGGTGYMQEYGYEKIMRDSRIFAIFEGANEVLRLFVGLSGVQGPGEALKVLSHSLKAPLEDVTHSLGVIGEYGVKWLRRRVGHPTEFFGVHEELKDHATRVENLITRFGEAVDSCLMKEGKKIVENEFPVRRLADMAIELFAMSAVLSRTTRMLKEKGKEKARQEMLMTRLFIRHSARRVVTLLRRMEKNDDTLEKQISDGLAVDFPFSKPSIFV